ncbi:hypothetical protein PC116_g34566, partial [Phytophthora cactorum]
MAVNGGRASLVPQNSSSNGRRIQSLSQITNNVPTGGIKRSQSVRTPAGAALRKSSWAPGKNGSGKGYGDVGVDKENVDLVRESDEEAREDSPLSEPEPETPAPLEDETVVIAADEDIPADDDEDEDATEMPIEVDEGNADEVNETGSEAGTTVITSAEAEGGY